MTRRVTILAFLVAVFGAGCAAQRPDPHVSLQYEDAWKRNRASSFVRRAGEREVAVFDLGRTAWVSHHTVVLRTAESPHYHRFHDLTVMLLDGQGIFRVGSKAIPMQAGDVVHVRRGTAHMFENLAEEPAVAFVIYSPPFDGRDRVEAEGPKPPPEAPETGWWPF